MRALGANGMIRFFQDQPQAFWALVAIGLIGVALMAVARFWRPAYVSQMEGGVPAFLNSRYYPVQARKSDAPTLYEAVVRSAKSNALRIPGYEMSSAEIVASTVEQLQRAALTRDYAQVAEVAAFLGDEDLADLIRSGPPCRPAGAERRFIALVDGWLAQNYAFAPEPGQP